MGSFSFNKCDNLGKYENVVIGEEFKFLIPKEFGGGFIVDKYQDYGLLGAKRITDKGNIIPKHDMFELLAFWNKEDVIPTYTEEVCHPMELKVGSEVTIEINDYEETFVTSEAWALNGKTFKIVDIVDTPAPKAVLNPNPFKGVHGYLLDGEASECGLWAKHFFKDTTWYERLNEQGLLFEGDEVPCMPEIGANTSHNRLLGIELFYRGDKYPCFHLKYPLKLVSMEYEGTYEDCEGVSTNDPDQGFTGRLRKENIEDGEE